MKRTLLEYLDAQLITAQDIVEQRRSDANDLAWDKVLVDEGQDWPEDERRILFALFEPRNLVVASGTGQLVRASEYADWTRGVDYHKPIVYEKRSLRQKKNLCQFLQSYANAFDLLWDLEASDDLLGGRVVISVGGVGADLLQALNSQCHKDGNEAYDFLFLAPPSLTLPDALMRCFAYREQFEQHGIRLWDGIPRDHRAEFPLDVNEHRVVTYESSRGLEGWVVACLDADSFFDYKLMNPYLSPTGEGVPSDLGLANPDQESQRIVHDWMLIAFTRAIDTLLIVVKDDQHPFSRKLLSIAGQLEDFVEVKYVPVGIT